MFFCIISENTKNTKLVELAGLFELAGKTQKKLLKSVKVQDWLSGRELPGWVSGITSKTDLNNDLGRYKALKKQGKQ